jgi:DNA polymerase (family X)
LILRVISLLVLFVMVVNLAKESDSMHVHNADIAAIFNEIADLLEIEGGNLFRVRAYRSAARTIDIQPASIQSMVEQGSDLKELPGIGSDLSARIAEIVHTGTCELRDRLRHELPSAIDELLRIPNLGPKRVRMLYQERGIHTLPQLLQAAEKGQLRTIPGFGARTEARILDAVRAQLSKEKRYSIAIAAQWLAPLIDYLKQIDGIVKVEVAGSFRRMRETVGDLDIVASAHRTEKVTQHFVHYGDVARVSAQGPTRASVVLRQGIQVDLRVVQPAKYGAALHYFTGSKAHSIEMRKLAQERGLKWNEYGVFAGKRRIAGITEQSMFEAVGLPWIAPELRENRGEIEAARQGRLPHLIELTDLKGDLHAHTTATDGQHSLREMALAAKNLGLTYLGITDHSRRMSLVHGLDAGRLSRQIDEIDQLNAELKGIQLLKGIEVDILEDGSLDLPDSVLRRLDYVLAAVHSKFGLSKERQTTRILRAMDNPNFTMLAHPSGRLLFERDAYEVDMPCLIRHAKERGCFLELDSQPDRLDLNDSYCMMAKDESVLVSIDSDAHNVADFNNLRFGIGQARRGWLEKKDVLNTRTLSQLKAILGHSVRVPAE